MFTKNIKEREFLLIFYSIQIDIKQHNIHYSKYTQNSLDTLLQERWLREGDIEQSQHRGSMVGSNNFESFSKTSNAHISSNTQPSAEMTFSFSLPAQTMNAEQQQVSSITQQPFVMGFQQQFKSGSIFGTSQMNVEPSIDNTAYSLAEELSEIELEAFRGRFVSGCIPTKPPTRELCG